MYQWLDRSMYSPRTPSVPQIILFSLTPNYPSAVNNETEDFLVVHPARSPVHHNPFYSMGMDLQTGTSVNMVSCSICITRYYQYCVVNARSVLLV